MRQTSTNGYLHGGVVLLTLLLTACASIHPPVSHLPPLQDQVTVAVPDVDFHAVSAAMQEFLDQYVAQTDSTDSEAWGLVWAVTNRNVLPFDYDPSLTQTSEQTFASHRGNCLAFSSMLVAMARHRGLKAWYQEVEIPPQWSSINNTLLLSKHVNVVVQGKHGEWVVDISGEGAAVSRKVKRISDAEALAQYYNNLGADALLNGKLDVAYAYITKALHSQPGLPYLWSNLAVVYSHNGQPGDATATYLSALELNPNNAVAANNLYLIYESEGKHEAAQKLLNKVERHRRNNPYYLYHLSELAFNEGRYEDSREMLLDAIELNENEYRFHYELARSLAIAGKLDAAQASLDQALLLAPQQDRSYNGWMDNIRIDALPPLPE